MLQAAADRLAALNAAITALARAETVEAGFDGVLAAVGSVLGRSVGTVWLVDAAAQVLRCRGVWRSAPGSLEQFCELTRGTALAKGRGLPGRVWESGQPAWIVDVVGDPNFPRAGAAREVGLHSAFAFPIVSNASTIGVIELFSDTPQDRDEALLPLVSAVGVQIGMFIDRLRMIEELRASEARKAAILEAALDCVVSIDDAGRILDFNPAAERTFGYRRAEVLGKDMAELIIPPSLRERHRQGLARHVANRTGSMFGRRFEMSAMRSDGSEFPVELTITEVITDGPALFTGYIRDITERKRAEEELRRRDEHLRLALDAGGMGTWEWNVVAGTVEWSPMLEIMHGIPVGSFDGSFEAYQSDIHPADRERVLRSIRETVEQRREHRLEYRIIRADGQIRWLEARGRLSCDSDGKPLRLIGVCMDVTERKRAELALRDSEVWLATTLKGIGDAVVATDREGRVRFMNPVAEHLTGWDIAEAAGKPLVDIFRICHEETRAPVESPVDKVLREGLVVGLANHTVLIRRDGSEVAIDDSAAPIRNDDGELIGVVLVFRDVSEKRREENRRRFLAEAAEALSSSLDYEKTLATVARLAVPKVADWCAVDMLGVDGKVSRLAVAHVDTAKIALAHQLQARYPADPNASNGIYNVLRTGRAELMEEIPDALLVAAAKDEAHLALARQLGLRSYVVAPLIARGNTLGTITFVTAESGRRYSPDDLELVEDLSRRMAIAVDNARLYRDAQRAVEAREDLLAIVSHDLRNPLGAAIMAAQLIEKRMLAAKDERTVDHARKILRAGARMEHLIRDLLDLAAIEAGKLSLDSRPHDTRALIADATELLQPLALQKSIQLQTAIEAGCGQVLCDRDRVVQVFSNLVGNAVKFTPERGGILLRARPRGDEVQFTVEDTGPGIPAEQLPHIFERFWKGSNSSATGSGLGLFIVHGIISAHRGRVSAESGVGQGARFCFTLPCADARPNAL